MNYNEFFDFSDEDLCRFAQDGERMAEEILASRYLKLVRACSRPYFLAGGSFEDVIQEGMLGFLRAIREFRPEENVPFAVYAERCIKNRIISGIRAAVRNKHMPLNNYLSIDPLSFSTNATDQVLHTPFADPEEQLLDRERYEELFSEVKSLLSDFEARILGLYLEGLTGREIAEKVGRTPKSVDNAVQRVRRKVARHLDFSDSR